MIFTISLKIELMNLVDISILVFIMSVLMFSVFNRDKKVTGNNPYSNLTLRNNFLFWKIINSVNELLALLSSIGLNDLNRDIDTYSFNSRSKMMKIK